MPLPIEPDEFTRTPGLEEWRADHESAVVVYRTGDFSTGARFVGEIAAIADELDHHPDVLVGYGTVEVRTTTHSTGGLTRRDVALAERITAAAAAHGFEVADED